MKNSRTFYITFLVLAALILNFGLIRLLDENLNQIVRLTGTILILGIGAVFILKGCAEIIEETTDILSKKTKLAGGLLQSIGTAFPDMALGIVAALVSLELRQTNYPAAVSFAIIAAATTFGSNIYNIAYSTWCIFRQNTANRLNQKIFMFPFLKRVGSLKPLTEHVVKPTLPELDVAIDVLTALTVITAVVAISMVLFGRVINPPIGTSGDLYQLIRPVGIFVFLLSVTIIYCFRKTRRIVATSEEKIEEKRYYTDKSNLTIFIHLLFSGVAILLAATAMVHAVQVFSEITHLPVVIAGVLAGVIGCLGEIIVIHNYSVNPNGRIADALVGVAMDNIVTTIGASVVAIMGGIFLGGNALILIFVLILTLNAVLIWQISRLKNFLFVVLFSK
jgi:hypothetical protein